MAMEEHWRVLVTLKDGTRCLQQPHFASRDDAAKYIDLNRDIMVPGEVAQPIRDFDRHVYPYWRPAR